MREPTLDTKRPSIRLLCLDPKSGPLISCTTSIHSLDNASNFYALSYCWGDEEAGDPILLDEKRFLVTSNLHAALSQLQETKYRVLWIDAICIDQTNIAEKNFQVGLMGRIYSSALMTVVWLGPASHDHERLVASICSLAEARRKPSASLASAGESSSLKLCYDFYTLPGSTEPGWFRSLRSQNAWSS